MKSSKLSAETALHMDMHNKKMPLTECVIFMDGLHSNIKDYITLTLWVDNPDNILHKVKKDPNYVWKPQMIMADENGTNKRAVENVLGEDMRQRTISCQWLFLQCARKIFHRIDKEDFMKLAKLSCQKCSNQKCI